MNRGMDEEDIFRFLEKETEPIPDIIGNKTYTAYRASVYLKDNTYLPCVKFKSFRGIVELAIQRFEEVKIDKNTSYMESYPEIIGRFIAAKSTLWSVDVSRVEKSPYAIPYSYLKKMGGETRMGWTSFTVIMNDGKQFQFGTSYSWEFFEMPEGYDACKIVEIIPNKNTSPQVFREKPFFNCYLRWIYK